MLSPTQIAAQNLIQQFGGTASQSAPPKPGLTQMAGNFFSNLASHVASLGESVVSPFTEGIASGTRAIQATPDLLAGIGDTITGDKGLANQRLASANQTMAKPLLGQNTLSGNTIEQNLGQAVKAGSFLIPGLAGEGGAGLLGNTAVGAGVGLAQGTGQAMTENANLRDVAKGGVQGAAGGAVLGAAANYVPKLLGKFKSNEVSPAVTDMKLSPEQQDIQNHITQTQGQQIAQSVTKNPLSPDEQALAVKQGRSSMQGSKVVIAPTAREAAMHEALQPLIDEGKVTANTDKLTGNIKPENQLKNADAVKTESLKTNAQVKEIAAKIDKADIASGKIKMDAKGKVTQGSWKPTDLIKEIYNTKDPVSVKPTDTFSGNLDNSVFQLISDAPKTTSGLVQLKEDFGSMIKKDYPNLYEQGMTPTRLKIQAMNETLRDFTAKQFPEGSLPDGMSYRDALMKQHNLMNAQDEMAQKFAREYPEGSKELGRIMKAHPELKRTLRRIGYGALGVGAAGYAFRKEVSKIVTGK